MRRTAQGALALSVGILVLSLASSYGWGDNADRLVTNKAVDTLPDEMLPFFQANRQYLVQHVKRPDPPLAASTNPLSTQSAAASAAPAATDFIQLDHYGP